jgi:hypothetical protein
MTYGNGLSEMLVEIAKIKVDSPAKKVWMGSNPSRCDICGTEIKETFVDGKTKYGPWEILCLLCHRKHGIGFGVGRGQRYSFDLNKLKWIEVERKESSPF